MKRQEAYLYSLLGCLILSIVIQNADQSAIYNITVQEKQILDVLCPEVDICDVNATSAVLAPNGLIRRGFVSCCKGCSCHPSCIEELNCCSQDQEHERTNISDDSIGPKRECLYTRISQSEDEIPVTVPAYHTIVEAPPSGCVDTKPLTIGPNEIVYPICDDDIFPTVNAYFPVYSSKEDQIYKNALCARCHGIQDLTPFAPSLVCRGTREFPITLSDQLYFLETGLLSTQCFLDFSFRNPSVISSKQCYKKVVTTCESDEVNIPSGFNLGNVDIDTVRSLCDSGLYSPMVLYEKVYKNAFCALCGLTAFKDLLCLEYPDYRGDADNLVHLLHADKFLKQVGKPIGKHPYPKVCMPSENTKDTVMCRRLYCSSGRIRSVDGDCVFITNSWSTGTILVQLKLYPKENNKNIRKIIRAATEEDLVEAITKGQPWSDKWSLMRVMKRQDDSYCSERGELNIIVETESNNIEDLYNTIKRSTNDIWTMKMNNSSFQFQQRFQDYMLLSRHAPNLFVPFWNSETRNSSVLQPYSDCEHIIWKLVHASKSFRSTPVQINKLILCHQVTLFPGEFSLGHHGTYLQSNLTRRTLLNFEFDLVLLKNVHARVCLSDTVFSLKQRSTGSQMISDNTIVSMLLAVLSFKIFRD